MSIPNMKIKNYDFYHKMANSKKSIVAWIYKVYFAILFFSVFLYSYNTHSLSDTITHIPLIILLAFMGLILVTPFAFEIHKAIENNKIVEGMELRDFWELVNKHPEEKEDIHNFFFKTRLY